MGARSGRQCVQLRRLVAPRALDGDLTAANQTSSFPLLPHLPSSLSIPLHVQASRRRICLNNNHRRRAPRLRRVMTRPTRTLSKPLKPRWISISRARLRPGLGLLLLLLATAASVTLIRSQLLNKGRTSSKTLPVPKRRKRHKRAAATLLDLERPPPARRWKNDGASNSNRRKRSGERR